MSNLAVTIAIIVGVFVLGCANGYAIRDGAAKTAAAKAFKAAETQRIISQEKLNAVSAQYEAEKERANLVATNRTSTIREYYNNVPAVAPSCALPDPMYGLLVNSVRDANIAASGELGSELPKSANAANH